MQKEQQEKRKTALYLFNTIIMTWALSAVRNTTLFIWWALGFTFWGFNFMVIAFGFFVFLCIIDTLYGYSLARTRLIVSSKSWDVGVYREVTQGMMILGIMVLIGALAKEVSNDNITMMLSAFVFVMIAGFSFGQITSLIENMAISAHGKELWFINLLLKIAGIWQAKIDEKVEKYANADKPQ